MTTAISSAEMQKTPPFDFKNFENDVYNSALIIEVWRPNGIFTCTGVAVTKSIVLTAAHCLDGDVNIVQVIKSYRYQDTNKQYFEVEKYTLHEKYDKLTSNYLFDIAKIKLKNPLPSDIQIFPISRSKIIDENVSYFRAGYGGRNNQNTKTILTPTLRNLDVRNHFIELNEDDSQSGDSGGPVFIVSPNKGKLKVYAIHSTLSYGDKGNYSFNVLLGRLRYWIYDEAF